GTGSGWCHCHWSAWSKPITRSHMAPEGMGSSGLDHPSPLSRYFFPRQLLIRHFWTPQQQLEFQDTYDSIRRDSYPVVLESLVQAAHSLPDPRLQRRLQQLCSQRLHVLHVLPHMAPSSPLGGSPSLFPPQQALSRVLFLTPHLPGPILRRRLRSHVLEIRELDLALQRLSLGQLHEEELRAACYLRGLNCTDLDGASCRAWLEQWLGLSCRLEGDGGYGAAPALWGHVWDGPYGAAPALWGHGWDEPYGAAPALWGSSCPMGSWLG
uniref:Uncharacterized protein n=1 Tax=Melopsittacus undulatus TaxID=13146 RepID=A0A8V5GRJ3_MELUD